MIFIFLLKQLYKNLENLNFYKLAMEIVKKLDNA